MTATEIVPNFAESLALVGRVPVLGWGMQVEPGGLAEEIAQALSEHRVVMVRGHGSFAVGQLLEDAINCTTALEESSQVICLLKSMQVSQVSQ